MPQIVICRVARSYENFVGPDLERVAKQRNARFFPVWLTCDAKNIRRRKRTAERKARLKDIDLSNISRWVDEFEGLKVDHPNGLTLDTSRCSPKEVAQLILKHVAQPSAHKY